jgi:tetratricopeptide (TPR) repeat protein
VSIADAEAATANAKIVHGIDGRSWKLLWGCSSRDVACSARGIPAPRDVRAVAGWKHGGRARRSDRWPATGQLADQPLLLERLRDDAEDVRGTAEQGLWLLWMRSGDPAIDRALAEGTALMAAGQLPQAIAVFSAIIRRRPGFAEGWNKRATAYFLAGDYQRSLADCGEVIKRNPAHFGALSGYGQIYFRLEQFDKAIEYWRRALQVNPNMSGVRMSIEGAEQLLREKGARTI